VSNRTGGGADVWLSLPVAEVGSGASDPALGAELDLADHAEPALLVRRPRS
jgi:hypothetical protein